MEMTDCEHAIELAKKTAYYEMYSHFMKLKCSAILMCETDYGYDFVNETLDEFISFVENKLK